MNVIIGILVVVALICGLALLLAVALGTLTPHLVGIAIVCLAVALLILVFGKRTA